LIGLDPVVEGAQGGAHDVAERVRRPGPIEGAGAVASQRAHHRHAPGVGRALLASVGTWAQERRADGISLQVAAANERGRKFYEGLGFREISVYEVLEF